MGETIHRWIASIPGLSAVHRKPLTGRCLLPRRQSGTIKNQKVIECNCLEAPSLKGLMTRAAFCRNIFCDMRLCKELSLKRVANRAACSTISFLDENR